MLGFLWVPAQDRMTHTGINWTRHAPGGATKRRPPGTTPRPPLCCRTFHVQRQRMTSIPWNAQESALLGGNAGIHSRSASRIDASNAAIKSTAGSGSTPGSSSRPAIFAVTSCSSAAA